MEYAGRNRVLPPMEHTTRTTPQTTSGGADGRYVFDQRRHDERERLAAMERLWGEVLATDISTLHLDDLDAPNLKVREHDILSDPLPEDAFDLVHARLVVEHLGRRSLQRAVSAVRPGG
jgi:SAM-dependent methyltransferase